MEGLEIRESARARHLRISVFPDGRVVVTKPARVGMRAVEKWVREKEAWIEKAREAFRKRKNSGKREEGIELPRLRRGTRGYKEAVEAARALARERLQYFNALYEFPYGTLSIRNQKTRWGSCSAAGNLSFNYRIAHLPPDLADYLIVHELCHVREHNHSARFWAQVARTILDYKNKRCELHRYRY
ncbi:MAG: YgjP-like metallopeptidase domain-containing protein [Patescibacteria group bacterium]